MTVRRSWPILLTLAAINAVEGFDVFLVGKIAPLIAHSYGVPARALAGTFVLHQIGLAIGALGGGRAGDRFGRRRVLAVSVALAGIATATVPACDTLVQLQVIRAITGVFIGAAGATILAVASSLGDKRQTALILSIVLAGYGVGSSAGSLFALTMVDLYGWMIGFGSAGILLFLLAVPAYALVQDTRSHSVVGPDHHIEELPKVAAGQVVRLCLAFFLTMGTISLLAAWLPTYFQDLRGIPVQRFARVGIFYAPAAVVGMIGMGWLAARFDLRSLTPVFAAHAIGLASLALVSFEASLFPAAYFLAIVGQAAGQALLNITVSRLFATASRGTAFGLMAAAGRCGGIVAPSLGALALDFRLSLLVLFVLLALMPLISGILLLHTLNRRNDDRL